MQSQMQITCADICVSYTADFRDGRSLLAKLEQKNEDAYKLL